MSRLQGEKPAESLPDIRCGACARKLGAGVYSVLSIKCPRCGSFNHLRAESATPARQRAPQHHEATHGNEEAIDRERGR